MELWKIYHDIFINGAIPLLGVFLGYLLAKRHQNKLNDEETERLRLIILYEARLNYRAIKLMLARNEDAPMKLQDIDLWNKLFLSFEVYKSYVGKFYNLSSKEIDIVFNMYLSLNSLIGIMRYLEETIGSHLDDKNTMDKFMESIMIRMNNALGKINPVILTFGNGSRELDKMEMEFAKEIEYGGRQ